MPTTTAGSAPRHDRTAAAILDAAAHAFSERGNTNMADVAEAAGVSRATLYRYFADRDALLEALAARALGEAASRIAGAGLERAPVDEAIERVVRAFTAVGDRYSVLLREQVRPNPDDLERLVKAPVQAVFERGVQTGVLRQDIDAEVLHELFGGVLVAALELVARERLGLEEASAAAASIFLNGARAR